MLSVWLTRQAQLGNVDDDLVIAINSIAIACKQIMSLVKAAPLQGNIGLAGGKNESGGEQKKLDVIANDIFLNAVKQCGRSSVIVTEEEDHPVFSATNVGNGDYVVTFDPIDGSSNIGQRRVTDWCYIWHLLSGRMRYRPNAICRGDHQKLHGKRESKRREFSRGWVLHVFFVVRFYDYHWSRSVWVHVGRTSRRVYHVARKVTDSRRERYETDL